MEKHPFTLEGRIRRTTFWFRTFIVIFSIYITVIIAIYLEEPMVLVANANIVLLLFVFWGMQGVKRVHDVNKEGWYAFIPFYNLILFSKEGDIGSNRFGEDPRGIADKKSKIRIQSKKSNSTSRAMRINTPNVPTKVEEVDARPLIKIKKRS